MTNDDDIWGLSVLAKGVWMCVRVCVFGEKLIFKKEMCKMGLEIKYDKPFHKCFTFYKADFIFLPPWNISLILFLLLSTIFGLLLVFAEPVYPSTAQ